MRNVYKVCYVLFRLLRSISNVVLVNVAAANYNSVPIQVTVAYLAACMILVNVTNLGIPIQKYIDSARGNPHLHVRDILASDIISLVVAGMLLLSVAEFFGSDPLLYCLIVVDFSLAKFVELRSQGSAGLGRFASAALYQMAFLAFKGLTIYYCVTVAPAALFSVYLSAALFLVSGLAFNVQIYLRQRGSYASEFLPRKKYSIYTSLQALTNEVDKIMAPLFMAAPQILLAYNVQKIGSVMTMVFASLSPIVFREAISGSISTKSYLKLLCLLSSVIFFSCAALIFLACLYFKEKHDVISVIFDNFYLVLISLLTMGLVAIRTMWVDLVLVDKETNLRYLVSGLSFCFFVIFYFALVPSYGPKGLFAAWLCAEILCLLVFFNTLRGVIK